MQDAMIDSGFQEIGAIPADWRVERLKALVAVVSGGTPEAGEISEEADVLWATPSDFRDGERHLAATRRKVTPGGHAQIGRVLLPPGSVLLSSRAPVGKVAYVEAPLSFNQGCKGLVPRRGGVSMGWLFYWLMSHRQHIENCARGTTFQEISTEALRRCLVAVPPEREQSRIAAWLDAQTGLLDRRLAHAERRRILLCELRSSLVSEAVAGRGAGGDRRGATWKVRRFKDLFRRVGRDRRTDDTVLSLSYGRVVARSAEERRGGAPGSYDTYQPVSPGDIVLRLTDLQNDQRSLRVGLATRGGVITSAYLVVRPRGGDPRFLYYLLHAVGDIHKVFYGLGGGVRQTIRYDELADLALEVPDGAEQVRIAAWLDRAVGGLDEQVARLERIESLLREQRACLIHEVVTGKRRVPRTMGSSPPPPDVAGILPDSGPELFSGRDLDLVP